MSRYELPECRWRRPGRVNGRQGCTSPIVKPSEWGVPDHQCWMCPLSDHLDPAAVADRRDHAGAVRHLLFHMYVFSDNWKWHAKALLDRRSIWNGRRIIALALDPGSSAEADVRNELRELDADFLVVPNDAQLREMASYPALVAALQRYNSPADVHFYGHSKGVHSAQWGPAAKRWAQAMNEALLDYWPAVSRALVDHCAVGIFRRLWRGPIPTRAEWHFSGSHRWIRNADFYSRKWRTFDRTWLGSETHPGLLFGRAESACLYGEFATQDCGLYVHEEWTRWAEPRRQEWLSSHIADRRQPMLATVILTACQQRELVHEAIRSVQGQTSDEWQLLVVDAGEMHGEGAYDRYAGDGRISVMTTGETEAIRSAVGIQGWAINRAMQSGRVRGDIVVCLCDDDKLDPTWLECVIAAARHLPDQSAWYGWADRQALFGEGNARTLGRLNTFGRAGLGVQLRGRVDGMQLAVRRAAWQPWPELLELAREADGHWMDAVGALVAVYPLATRAGWHRHTALSTFTTPLGPRGVRC